jgi:hypothetical protein
VMLITNCLNVVTMIGRKHKKQQLPVAVLMKMPATKICPVVKMGSVIKPPAPART